MLFQGSTSTTHRTASTYTCHKDVNLAFALVPYLFASSGKVDRRVGRVLKLLEDDRTWDAVTQFFSLADSALHAFRTRSKHYLSTISCRKLATFDAHRL